MKAREDGVRVEVLKRASEGGEGWDLKIRVARDGGEGGEEVKKRAGTNTGEEEEDNGGEKVGHVLEVKEAEEPAVQQEKVVQPRKEEAAPQPREEGGWGGEKMTFRDRIQMRLKEAQGKK